MARYTDLAVNSGASIVGGCCGTSFHHLSAMRAALDAHQPGQRPDEAAVVAELGALQAPGAKPGHRSAGGSASEGRRGRRG